MSEPRGFSSVYCDAYNPTVRKYCEREKHGDEVKHKVTLPDRDGAVRVILWPVKHAVIRTPPVERTGKLSG